MTGGTLRLRRVLIRFYKSFNFDYERRARGSSQRPDWEMLPEGWYPYVRLDLEPTITAVVGANESGKTHLLDAVECALGARPVQRSDFCRHSQFYSVETGAVRTPDVGVEFEVETPSDVEALSGLGHVATVGSRRILLRPGGNSPAIVLDGESIALSEGDTAALVSLLPRPVRLSTSIAIPDSVSISRLSGAPLRGLHDRARRSKFLDLVEQIEPNADALSANVPSMAELLGSGSGEQAEQRNEAAELARQLLIDVARVDHTVFADLQQAINVSSEGEAKGLEARINSNLSRNLNLTRWWSQDEEFELRVQARERELVFTIRDRTGTDYSFAERSRGLTHFLAYYVQLRARQRGEAQTDILLMDEPDAYLSNVGQQDLLRVLENYAHPETESHFHQVLYVTHSPYLINRNAAHRVRVLDKGAQEEGTRVVKDVARTHYEPLRSALGPHVAETVFIGGTNLIVEGLADQVLLAGISNALRRHGSDTAALIDLNEVTIVPAGSSDSIAYIAYLARGRDTVKPPCVALLDGDEAGIRAEKKLLRAEANRKPILHRDRILRIDRWAVEWTELLATSPEVGAVKEIEDLIPARIAVSAAKAYAKSLLGVSDREAERLKEADLKVALAGGGGVWDALENLVAQQLDGLSMDKVGFARHVVAIVQEGLLAHSRPVGLPALVDRFSLLLRTLNDNLREAGADEHEKRRNRKMDRSVRRFLEDHPDGAIRSTADTLLRSVEASLADIAEHDVYRQEIVQLRRAFELRKDPNKPVGDFTSFRDGLRRLLIAGRLESQEADGG